LFSQSSVRTVARSFIITPNWTHAFDCDV